MGKLRWWLIVAGAVLLAMQLPDDPRDEESVSEAEAGQMDGVILLASDNNEKGMDRSLDRNREANRIVERLDDAAGLTDREARQFRNQVERHLELGGTGETVREMARISGNEGCTGACLSTTLRAMNHAMWQGYSTEEARRMVSMALREAARAGGEGGGLEDRFEARMERQLRKFPSSPAGSGMGGGGMGGGGPR